MYIIARMGWVGPRAAAGTLAALLAAACAGPFGRHYEYEEQLYLSVNGSATVLVDSSIAALVALRGVALDPRLQMRVDREQVRRVFEEAGCHVVRVGQPWVRNGRRFVQIRLEVDDVLALRDCRPLAWSTYSLDRQDGFITYRQVLGPAADGEPPATSWKGDELVAFKLHLPSRVVYHNVRRLEDGSAGSVDRGNILTWEQRLTDRLAGVPIQMEVRMQSRSILFRTLWLFGGSFLAAVALLVGLVWWTVRTARRKKGASASAGDA